MNVIILAAGSSSRMGGKDKILEKLSNSMEVIINTIYKFDCLSQVRNIVLVTRKDILSVVERLIKKYKFTKNIYIVKGGRTRTHSLFLGLDFLKDNLCFQNNEDVSSVDDVYCLVHDGARPLVNGVKIVNCFNDAVKFGAAALGIKVNDTVKRCDDEHIVVETVDRRGLFCIQTPQIFRLDILSEAVLNAQKNALDFTDDCQLIESIGGKVHISSGDLFNIKITTPNDLELVDEILRLRSANLLKNEQ